jgi:hypothetical protein
MEIKDIDFLAELNTLSDNEDLIGIGRELNELKVKFDDHILAREHNHQVAQMEAKDRGEELEDDSTILSEKESFYSAYNEIREKRKALLADKNKSESENLKQKRFLIQQFKDVVANEENIGTAFKLHKEINEKWKAIGDIPRDKRHDIQQEYSRLLEEFFYNMKIYKEIKEYDFKKNLDLKKGVIEQLKKLKDLDKIKEIESELKKLQNEWEDIGPTVQEEWEALKEDYWSTVRELYDRIKAHYDQLREQMQDNIAAKKELIARTQNLLQQERPSVKSWNKQTNTIKDLQADWKKIGFGPKKENEEVWKEFRALCDQFFEDKSKYFENIQGEFDEIAEKKEKLIEEVEQLKDSEDWKETTHKIIKIQKSWKEIGSAGQKNEQRLWKRFRTACDYFFTQKENHYKQMDQEKEENLKLKEQVIQEIEAIDLPKEKEEALEILKSFANRFESIGFVPLKQKDTIFKSYKSALNKHYEAMNLKGEEKEKILFQAKIDTLKGSGDADKMLSQERAQIKKQIDDIKKDILQFENNMGFFANAADDHPLKAQAMKNIEAEKEKIERLKQKLKLIPKS